MTKSGDLFLWSKMFHTDLFRRTFSPGFLFASFQLFRVNKISRITITGVKTPSYLYKFSQERISRSSRESQSVYHICVYFPIIETSSLLQFVK